MSYHSDLLKRIERTDWPEFQRNGFLYELHELANEMHSQKSVAGYLASFLIYQQLCEEIVRLLIGCSDLFLQCQVFPQEFKPKKLDSKTFGQLIVELENGVCDKQTYDLIKKCKELNALRIRMVHRITLKTSVRDIERQAKSAKRIYDQIYKLFDKVRDQYNVTFGKYDADEMRKLLKDL